MKKLLLAILVTTCLSVACLATGINSVLPANIVGGNPVQTGTWASTNIYTNVVTFPYAYPVPPIVTVTGASVAITNVVTATNFTVSSVAATNTYNWSAYYPYPRFQSGTVITLAGVATNVTFPIAYSSAPFVNIEGSVTNGNSTVALQSVTPTGFTIICNTLNTNYWDSLGPCANPGTAIPTQ